jgi:hypothetical protein
MRRTPSVVIAVLLLLALLPVAAAVSVPSTERRLRNAFTQNLAVVSAPFKPSSSAEIDTLSDLGVITIVGVGLLGLAAVVRKATGA